MMFDAIDRKLTDDWANFMKVLYLLDEDVCRCYPALLFLYAPVAATF